MPYYYDMKKCPKLYHMNLNPFGWTNCPVSIVYGTSLIHLTDPQPSVCMQVEGTEHVWAWFVSNINSESKGDYGKIFTKTLENFRLDMLKYLHAPEARNIKWVLEYWRMFKGRFYDFNKEEKAVFQEIYEKGLKGP